MSLTVRCVCGQLLKAPDEYAGKRAECLACGRILTVPEIAVPPAPTGPSGDRAAGAAQDSGGADAPSPLPPIRPAAAASPPQEQPLDVTEFLDPPSAAPQPAADAKKAFSLRPMFEALLDPRSIQWMLTIGGGLVVLGLIIWLVSKGIFQDPWVLAATLAAGTLSLLAAGWYVTLRTRFKVAGQALTFLACVVAPLNLWFLDAQNLVTLDNKLWLGGLVCSLLYIVTVFVLRDPLFLYAVELGVSLTVGLFLAELHLISDTTSLCLALMSLGLISVHAERAFPPGEGHFTRPRFGLPLFWSGQVQAAAGLIILLITQVTGWLVDPAHPFLQLDWAGNRLTESSLLAGALWLAGSYLYVYSDLVVRRVGVYCYLAACCLVLAEVTLIGERLDVEWLIAVLAITALAATFVQTSLSVPHQKLGRAFPPLAIAFSALPVLMGIALHVRATSRLAADYDWAYTTTWAFVAAMVVVTLGNRLSAYLCRHTGPNWSAAHFFLSAAAAIVAAAGMLRMCGLSAWTNQAPLLMLLPIGYLLAARLWRGHTPERPLGWVAHAAAMVILVPVLISGLLVKHSLLRPLPQELDNLLLGLVFTEAALFYTLAAFIRRRSANAYFATICACGALWQFLGYWDVPETYHAMLYSVLGVALLFVARSMGVEQLVVYRQAGEKGLATRGRGLPAFQMGNAILCIAVLAAALQSLMHLRAATWDCVGALVLTTLASLIAAALSLPGGWRRTYLTSAVALAGVTFLTLNVLSHLSPWQKLEIFCVVVGVLLVSVSYGGRFREATGADTDNEMVSVGLWLGSVLTTVPLLVAVIYHRFTGGEISLLDEIGLITATVLMLVTGCSWQIKSTTFFGGSTLFLYLVLVVVRLAWQPQVAVGVYLAIAGAAVFGLGITLSVYRERLLQLPDRVAKREGLFRILNWR